MGIGTGMQAWEQVCIHGNRYVCMGTGMYTWEQVCIHGNGNRYVPCVLLMNGFR